MQANAVADKYLKNASQHSHGKLPITLKIGKSLEQNFNFEPGQFTGIEASGDESDPELDQF